MIFYFTGTGNSLAIAKSILQENERLISMADAEQNESYEYEVKDNEAVGFVFPVYFYTLPKLVERFIDNIKLSGATYIYGIITCGGGISQAGNVLKKKLEAKDLRLEYLREVLMPDNSMLFYQIPPVSESGKRLEAAKECALEIKNDIINRKTTKIGNGTLISKTLSVAYELCCNTDKFYADDKCVGCGLCEKICPEKVISISDGKPQWNKSKCGKCSACINRCPSRAIQYGKATRKRNRYVHPEYK